MIDRLPILYGAFVLVGSTDIDDDIVGLESVNSVFDITWENGDEK